MSFTQSFGRPRKTKTEFRGHMREQIQYWSIGRSFHLAGTWRDQTASPGNADTRIVMRIEHAAARYDHGSEFHTRCRFEASSKAAWTTDPRDAGVVFRRLFRGCSGDRYSLLADARCDVGEVLRLADHRRPD